MHQFINCKSYAKITLSRKKTSIRKQDKSCTYTYIFESLNEGLRRRYRRDMHRIFINQHHHRHHLYNSQIVIGKIKKTQKNHKNHKSVSTIDRESSKQAPLKKFNTHVKKNSTSFSKIKFALKKISLSVHQSISLSVHQ